MDCGKNIAPNSSGKVGESLAVDHICTRGYKIMATNWFFKHKEIDIIAAKDGKIIFLEVKTRGRSSFGTPASAVTFKKQRFLIEAANAYMVKHSIELEARFDVVSVIMNGDKHSVEIIENAFYPMVR